jgi:Fe-S-cluster containining protein
MMTGGQGLAAATIMTTHESERFEIALNTPAGQVTAAVEVPVGFIPITAIVPLVRRMGEEAQALEAARSVGQGKAVSCQKGCAACCRMLVPLSAPEAFSLREFLSSLPAEAQQRLAERFTQTRSVLVSDGLWGRLMELAESGRPPDDDALDPVNRAYYALRTPCPFLEDELCSIYEERPSACRELLVTSPATWCQDIMNNPVEQIPVPLRASTVLGLLWGDLTRTPARLIPLPVALEWAERHRSEQGQTWPGTQLLDQALDKAWRFLGQVFQSRSAKADG